MAASRSESPSRHPGSHPDPSRIRLGVEQLRPRKADVEGNLATLSERIAAAAGALDLLVFPETVTSGYFVEGGVEEVARSAGEIVRGLGTPPAGAPDVVLGFYERGPDGVLYNAAIHLEPVGELEAGGEGEGEVRWAVVHLHRKMFLPTYGLFDEARFVKPGLSLEAYDTRFGRMGLLICEEMLHSLPPAILALDGAELLVALSASPAREYGAGGGGLPASLERWHVAGRALAMEHGIHLALAHLVGSEGGRIFAGGSAVYGPGGRILGQAPLFRESRLDVQVPLDAARRARVRSPMLEDLRAFLPHLEGPLARAAGRGPEARTLGGAGRGGAPHRGSAGTPASPGSDATGSPYPDPADRSPLELDLPLLEEALVSFLRDEVTHRRGFERVVVGVSGGVDSAVTTALAVRAFGAEQVRAFLLPYATSSEESLLHGREVCRTFGVQAREIPITPSVDAYVEGEEPELSPRRRGNLAARFRALVLWDQSAAHDALILGTGNKSERLLGYFTWHADDAPPVNPLGDLLKTQVWALARHLGVPEAVVSKPASADLVRGVHDEDELGVRYEDADLVLHWLLEGVRPGELEAAGFGPAVVGRVHGLLSSTHWKRRPPATALVSSSGIGDFYLRPVDF
jgi:NAD+ synthase (glutamine-hydrolysing)